MGTVETGFSPSQLIDARIRELGDWRGEMLSRVRRLIHEADPAVVEEWKWRGVPVWSHAGIICTGETYRNVVERTFAWIMKCRRLVRDYEQLTGVAESLVSIAAATLLRRWP